MRLVRPSLLLFFITSVKLLGHMPLAFYFFCPIVPALWCLSFFFLKKGDVGTVGFVEECGSGCGRTLASSIHSAESFPERWWENASSRRNYYSWFGRQEVVSLQKLVFWAGCWSRRVLLRRTFICCKYENDWSFERVVVGAGSAEPAGGGDSVRCSFGAHERWHPRSHGVQGRCAGPARCARVVARGWCQSL